jgi:gliding motility-associated-like protein
MLGTLVYLLLLGPLTIFGQNLVRNPSFEELSDCPQTKGLINLAVGWEAPTSQWGSVLNSCSDALLMAVPNAGHYVDSYQQPRTGEGYGHLVGYHTAYYSYLSTTLMAPLKANTDYFLRFFVSPDVSESYDLWDYTDAIGMTFTDTAFYQENGFLPDPEVFVLHELEPTIEHRGTLITDTVGWTPIRGCYTARGGESYLVIGNFRMPWETLRGETDPGNPNSILYYYVDDVLVAPFDPLPDTLLLCAGESATLSAGFFDASYEWNTGHTDSVLTVSEGGRYIVTAWMDGCALHDTVEVIDVEEVIGTGWTDTTVCRETGFVLTPPLPGTYTWSDGSTSSRLSVESSGYYEVEVENSCGQFRFSRYVEQKDCDCSWYVPNAFSPNFDGRNDELTAYPGCDFPFEFHRFTIFDRWGNEVYRSTDAYQLAWDGTSRGQSVPGGVYVWLLEYTVLEPGGSREVVQQGDVLVVR